MAAQGKRRYDRKQSGYGGQTKPVFHKKVRRVPEHKSRTRIDCRSGRLGQDDEEGRSPARVHRLQVQDAAFPQALQAVRLFASCSPLANVDTRRSFELGGEKKTKGAALQFVRALLCMRRRPADRPHAPFSDRLCLISPLSSLLSVRLPPLSTSRALCSMHAPCICHRRLKIVFIWV